MTDSSRPKSLVPPYPPYKKGLFLEEHVYEKLSKEDLGHIEYIDIFWTNLYSNRSFGGVQFNIQNELDALSREATYFTVCQNDDGVLESLPPNTIKFCAGGNRSDEMTIPIPLIVDGFPVPEEKLLRKAERPLLASFVGSNTHPIRAEMHRSLRQFQDTKMTMKGWDINVKEDQFDRFISDSIDSYFILAPRGYGKTSFRLYEALLMERVPVYISDSHFLPYDEKIDWSSIAILCNESDIPSLHYTMKNVIDSGRYWDMIEKIKEVKHMFTMDYMVEYIKETILKFKVKSNTFTP